jgi:hypothetical protein
MALRHMPEPPDPDDVPLPFDAADEPGHCDVVVTAP